MTKERWTADQDATIRKMIKERKSYGAIAVVLKRTRSAVAGRAHRLDLTVQGQGKRRDRENNPKPAMTHKGSRFIYGKQSKAAQPMPEEVPHEGPVVAITELKADSCRWPVGDPKQPGFGYCGRTQLPEKPYCAGHCKVAYVTPRGKLDGLVDL